MMAMKMRVLVAAVLSATLGLTWASGSYADMDTQGTTTASVNAATPALPGSAGTPATPAVPGNPTAQAASEKGELTGEPDRRLDLAHDRARLQSLKALAAQYTANGQTEKAEAVRVRIHRLRVRMDRIRDHIQATSATDTRRLDLAHDRARLQSLKALAAQYTASGQTEKAEAVRVRIHRLRVRMDRIRDHIQAISATDTRAASSERARANLKDVDRTDIDRPHIDRPHIDRPHIDRPHIDRPVIVRPEIEHPEILH
jgi:hypothetical protein